MASVLSGISGIVASKTMAGRTGLRASPLIKIEYFRLKLNLVDHKRLCNEGACLNKLS